MTANFENGAPGADTREAGPDVRIEILQRNIKQLVADAINYGKNCAIGGIPSQAAHFQKMMVEMNDAIAEQFAALAPVPSLPPPPAPSDILIHSLVKSAYKEGAGDFYTGVLQNKERDIEEWFLNSDSNRRTPEPKHG